MRRFGRVPFGILAIAIGIASGPALLLAQNRTTTSHLPDAATQKAIADKASQLGKILASLHRQGISDQWLADVEVYHRAAALLTQHQEYFQPESAAWMLEALDRGLLRARLAASGEMPWLQAAGFAVVRGYRSRIDGSVQPYAVTFPANYGAAAGKRWRLDVVLHGREANLNEIRFLHQHNGDRLAPKDQDFVQIDIYGRGNNAYRWAGESDVLEALDAFVAAERQLGRDKLLDPARLVLRGFSMGGAGTWHLGLHMPDRWCVIGPGAGFTATHGYTKSVPARLPSWQEACLTIYDAIDYAENAFDVPVVAYCGSDDPLLEQTRNLEARLKALDIPMKLLVARDLKHKMPSAWEKKAEEAYAPFVARGRAEYPSRVRFVTYTLRYPRCDWVEILGLEHHYQRARVDARKTDNGFTVQTENVRILHLTLPVGAPQALEVSIDTQVVPTRPVINPGGSFNVFLRKQDGKWRAVLPQRLATEQAQKPYKAQGLQGPIDDAFTGTFLCVVGTERPWHEATQKYAAASLERFRGEWSKYWRGDLPVKDDVDVSNEDLATRNLILFGDPASNSLIAQVLDGLPLHWTRESLTFAGKGYPAADHVPALIYPSPLNPARYVVLNSGHTFHARDYQGTNALLFPRLGDYAVLRVNGSGAESPDAEVAAAGLFDERWQIPEK